jgi:glycosyltransferase involved in cell wall biosynthesis
MNICLLSREYPPDTAWGGIGIYTYQLAHGLTAKGHSVHVVCQGLDGDREYADDAVNVYRIWHRTFFPLKGKFREFGLRWEYSQSVNNKLRGLIEKYKIDVVEAPNLSGEGFIYSFHKKTPLVTRLHTHFMEVINFLGWKRSFDRYLSCWFENAAILRSDLITCSTKAHAELIARKLGINSERIEIIPLGTNLPVIPRDHIINSEPIILFVGRLEKRKGIHILIQAIPLVLKDIPNATFIIVGRDTFITKDYVAFFGNKEHSYKEQLLKMVPNEYTRKVQFLGYVDSDELDSLYRLCDIFVAPSLYESFGLIYIEAMAYGKPVIGCSVGGVPEVVKDGETGVLVPPENIYLLAKAIISLLNDSRLRLKMGNNAREYVKNNFTREIMVEKTLAAYKKVSRIR